MSPISLPKVPFTQTISAHLKFPQNREMQSVLPRLLQTETDLRNSDNFVELKIAYYDIQEVVISKFKPTGNLRKDVSSLKTGDKLIALQQMIGLPEPKGDGTPPELPVAPDPAR